MGKRGKEERREKRRRKRRERQFKIDTSHIVCNSSLQEQDTLCLGQTQRQTRSFPRERLTQRDTELGPLNEVNWDR